MRFRQLTQKLVLAMLLCILSSVFACQYDTSTGRLRPTTTAVGEELQRVITHEMGDKGLPAFSIALVDDQKVVWAKGCGFADREQRVPATTETVYRVGSVSKLFTDIGIMQLVERGRLDLDAPVTRYLPDFQPPNPFHTPITLRQLMSHRSGLIREPPAGNTLMRANHRWPRWFMDLSGGISIGCNSSVKAPLRLVSSVP